MKRLLVFFLVITLCASCTRVLEGELLQLNTSLTNKNGILHVSNTAVMLLDGDTSTVPITETVAEEYRASMDAGRKQLFIRLVQCRDGIYDLQEIALRGFDPNNPNLYEFMSDNKVVGICKNN